jgi:predicted O-methyltransferase YrrM
MMTHPMGVKFLQRKIEFLALMKVFDEKKPLKVLEIGSYQGGTLWFWLTHAPRGAHIVSVDRKNEAYRKMWQRWTPRGIQLDLVEGESGDAATIRRSAGLLQSGVDFLFIDGGHAYETAKQDWENYSALLNPGGIAALHDILESDEHPEYGVHRLWSELKRTHTSEELMSVPNQRGMGIGVIYL